MKSFINRSYLITHFFAVFLITTMHESVLAEESMKVSSYSSIKLGGNLFDSRNFLLELELINTDCKNYKINKKQRLWGMDGTCPHNSIKSLKFYVEGILVKLPRESFTDLANIVLPTGVYIMSSKNTINLYMKGGDGVASYDATFIIRDNSLSAREVTFMNPDGELETTIQNYVDLDKK